MYVTCPETPPVVIYQLYLILIIYIFLVELDKSPYLVSILGSYYDVTKTGAAVAVRARTVYNKRY